MRSFLWQSKALRKENISLSISVILTDEVCTESVQHPPIRWVLPWNPYKHPSIRSMLPTQKHQNRSVKLKVIVSTSINTSVSDENNIFSEVLNSHKYFLKRFPSFQKDYRFRWELRAHSVNWIFSIISLSLLCRYFKRFYCLTKWSENSDHNLKKKSDYLTIIGSGGSRIFNSQSGIILQFFSKKLHEN